MYNAFVTTLKRSNCFGLLATLSICFGCSPKPKPVASNPFDAYISAFDNCVIGSKSEGKDCSEFETNDGPLTVALIKGVKEIPTERKKLIDAAESNKNLVRQEAAFSILRRALTREEMLPICKKVGENPDSERIVMVLVYLLRAGEEPKFDGSDAPSYQLASEIVLNTILKTTRSQNITVTANNVYSLGLAQSGQAAYTFMLSLKLRLRRGTDSVKLIRNMIRQSYNYGFFPKKDILAMRKDVEKVYGKEAGADMFTFTTEYANLKKY